MTEARVKPGPRRRGKEIPCGLEGCGQQVYRRPSEIPPTGIVYCSKAHQLEALAVDRPCKCGCGLLLGRERRGRVYLEGHIPPGTRWTGRLPDAAERDFAKQRKQRLGRYGITPATYDAILEAQGGGCAICGQTREEEGQHLSVDHDHACCPIESGSCGLCVRGLLCNECNGRVRAHERDDRPTLWPEAEDYLARYARDGSPVLAFIGL